MNDENEKIKIELNEKQSLVPSTEIKKLERLITMEAEGRLEDFLEKQDEEFINALGSEISELLNNESPSISEKLKTNRLNILAEIKKCSKNSDISSLKSVSFTDWQDTINENFPELVRAAEVGASVIAQLRIADIKNPCALIFVDVPSSGKTITLNFFSGLKSLVYTSDNFTPASFVSHAANVKKEKLAEIDLLPRIKDKVLIIRELATIFGAREEDLLKNFGILTRVLDGEGLETDSGVHGKRGYGEDINFMLLGASTPIQPRVWKLMGNFGGRLFFFCIRSREKEEWELADQLQDDSWKEKQTVCQEVTSAFLETLWVKYPEPIEWQKDKDPRDCVLIISKCAKLLARLRASINVWKDKGSDDKEYTHTVPVIEKPDRINQILYNLARGHALAAGRTQITFADLSLVINVTYDSAQTTRTNLFRLLIENNGQITTSIVAENLRCSDETARKEMETLKVLGLVDLSQEYSVAGRPENEIVLKPEFQWFISEESKKFNNFNTTSNLIGKVPDDSLPSKSDIVSPTESFENTEESGTLKLRDEELIKNEMLARSTLQTIDKKTPEYGRLYSEWAQLREAGLKRGLFDFFTPSGNDLVEKRSAKGEIDD